MFTFHSALCCYCIICFTLPFVGCWIFQFSNHTFKGDRTLKLLSSISYLGFVAVSSYISFSFSAVLVSNHTIVTQFCKDHNIGLVVVGQETLLAAGKAGVNYLDSKNQHIDSCFKMISLGFECTH